MSSNHLEFVVVLSSLIAHGNHLGTFKNTDAWVPPQRFWCIGLGCNLGIRIAQSSPCGSNGPQPRLRILLPSAEASCWVWRIKFIPMSTSKYKFLACHPHDKSHRLLFWEVGYDSKILQNAISKLEKEAKVCSGFYHFFPPSTQLKNETPRK